jgi:ABC-type nitrate/sulfonate/bicarbonate transport system substrate-binding protein
MYLEQQGVDASQVIFVGVGSSTATRIAALQAGAIDGNVGDTSGTVFAESLGFPLLVDLGSVVPIPFQGLVTTDEFIQTNRDTLRRFLRGLVRGIQYTKQNPRDVAALAQKELSIDMDEALAVRAVELYANGLSATTPGYATPAQMDAFYTYDVKIPMEIPLDQPLPQLHDFSVLLEAYDELGIPRPR